MIHDWLDGWDAHAVVVPNLVMPWLFRTCAAPNAGCLSGAVGVATSFSGVPKHAWPGHRGHQVAGWLRLWRPERCVC